MKRILTVAAITAMLAACADETTTDVVDPDPDPDPEVVDPSALTVGDLRSATINDDGTLTLAITLDGGLEVGQEYGPADSTDGIYSFFTLDESTTGRLFTAISAEDSNAVVSAVVASDGGQFNRYFGGASVSQNEYVAPDGGTTDFAGSYYGLLNFGDETQGGDFGDSSIAVRSYLVEGQAFLKVDFTDSAVNGSVYDRSYDNAEGTVDLPEIVLVIGTLTADGTFSGGAELSDADLSNVGAYSGVVGGDGGTAVAGILDLGAGFADGATFTEVGEAPVEIDLGSGNEAEHGIFVLTPLSD